MKEENIDIRQVLLETAREAFLEKGYKAVSMREISEKSGVGLSNIYNYFESKDELFKVVLTPFFALFRKNDNRTLGSEQRHQCRNVHIREFSSGNNSRLFESFSTVSSRAKIAVFCIARFMFRELLRNAY